MRQENEQIPPSPLAAGLGAFEAWWDRWSTSIYENGPQGEPEVLLAALWAEWQALACPPGEVKATRKITIPGTITWIDRGVA